MRHFLLLALVVSSISLHAQDTTVVNTLTFDSITTRRGWWEFPPASAQFRKVLMVHTLKCDPQTTQDGYQCGEWDYLTYHFVHEHTGVMDSTALTHPYFKVGTAVPDSVWVGDQQAFIHPQRWIRTDTVLSVNQEDPVLVGAYDLSDPGTFQGSTTVERSQYLYRADELLAAGLASGLIKGLRFPLEAGSGAIPKLIIRMGTTADTALTTFIDAGLTTVFRGAHDDGPLDLVLSQAFDWDGIGNILLDIAVEGIEQPGGYVLQGTQVPTGTAVQEIGTDAFVEVGNDFIAPAPGPLATLGDAVTITARVFGAPQLPLNTTLFEAVNADGQRLLNAHVPWSNGRVYWDAGNDGSGYDRIDRAANEADFKGQWNDWAFVKNVTSGSMKVYLNGVLWHSGTGKTKPLEGSVRMRIGSDVNGGNPFPGWLDEVNVFNTEVSAATIAAWHDRKVTADHPNHSALLYQFSMDEDPILGSHVLTNGVDPTSPAWLMGTVRRLDREPTDLRHAPTYPTIRPVVTFVQGDHVVGADSALVTAPDMIAQSLLTREIFAVQGNGIVPVDTLFGYAGAFDYTVDPEGVPVDSISDPGGLAYNAALDYFGVPFEVVNNHEIGRYITPYGIGLSLGPNGFSWVYDVTEYQHLLRDSVELSAGNQQELIDLKFLFIDGVAPRPLVATQRPWGPMRSYSYASLSDDSQLAPVTIGLNPQATQWMLRSRLTGHGHNSNDGNYPHCCEWKDNTHYLSMNGQQVDQWHIWQEDDCANNPVYPQGGTWLGSREGWCPGDLVKDRDTQLMAPVGADSITLDYSITPVPLNNLGMGGGNYVINMDLFEYGPPSHSVDAEIYDVRRPSDSGYRSRENPICHDPVLVLRNNGTGPLTSVSFSYSVSGGQPATYTWNGDLAPMARTEVTLSVTEPQFWAGDGENNFDVTITGVNGGGPDMYAANDHYRTHFTMPVVYPTNFVVYYKTNNRAYENALYIRDINGDVVFSRTTLTANTTYRDTLELPSGCYELEFTDSGNDGLSYWADPDAGSGFFRFRSLSNVTLRNFEAEFGHRIYAAFGIGTITGITEPGAPSTLTLYPNPTDGRFSISGDDLNEVQRIDLMDATGRMARTWNSPSLAAGRIDLDLTDLPGGTYIAIVHRPGDTRPFRIVKQ